ncbi:MAG: hypothetical protein LBB11_02495, partial [Puniceicoccales bacterium]|nr:hypothetical protein [Puniceicoccales bacterium]
MEYLKFYGLKFWTLVASVGIYLSMSPFTMAGDPEEEEEDIQAPKVRKIPWPKGNYHHFSKNQDLAELLHDFCVMQGISVIVNPSIKEMVNGRFSDIAPEQFWDDIVSAYNLVWFFDGNILYVYESSQIQTQVWSMTSDEMNTICRVVDELGIASSHLSMRRLKRAGILVVSGPPRLISVVGELSQKIVIERIDEITDIKIFPLKHACAYDMSITSKDGSIVIPGMATMLQQLLVTKQQQENSTGSSVFNLNSADKTKAQPQKNLIESKVLHENDKSTANTPESEGGNQNIHIDEDTLISFDARLNAVIIKGKKQNMPFFGRIIQEMDVASKVIRIDVAIVDVSKKVALEFGAELMSI